MGKTPSEQAITTLTGIPTEGNPEHVNPERKRSENQDANQCELEGM